jgi:hypothetical protein
VLNLSDKVKILDLLRGGMSLKEFGQPHAKDKSSILSIVLNSTRLFLNGTFLETIYYRYQGSNET